MRDPEPCHPSPPARPGNKHKVRRVSPRLGVVAACVCLPTLALVLLLLPLPSALAQPQPGGPVPSTADTGTLLDDSTPTEADGPTVDLVERRIDEAEVDASLDETSRAALIERYRAVLSTLKEREDTEAKARAYREALESGPEQADAIREAIATERAATQAEPEGADADTLREDADIDQIEALLSRTQAEISTLEAQVAELAQLLDDTDQEPASSRQRLAEAQAALEDLGTDLRAPAPSGLSSAEQEARRWLLIAKRDALRTELLMLEQQLLSADARRDLWSARREQKVFELERVRARREQLNTAANTLRMQQAQAVSEETAAATRDSADAHPLVREFAKRNEALGKDITRTTEQLDAIETARLQLDKQSEIVAEEFRSARQRLDAAGLSRALGQVLLDQRQKLPNTDRLRADIDARAEEIADVTLKQIRDREELRRLGELETWLDTALAEAQPPAGAQVRDDLRAQAELRARLLERNIAIEESYRRALGELNFAANRLLDAVGDYERFLAERLLWVRSIAPLVQQDFSALPAAVLWLISPENWAQLLALLAQRVQHSPLLWLGLGAVALLLWRGAAMRRAIRATAEPLRRISTDRFSYTLKALGLTLLAAAPWSLLLLVLGLELAFSPSASGFTKAFGAACLGMVPTLFYLRAFQLLCMKGGVADRHFRWSSDVLRLLRRTFALAAAVIVPIGFVAASLYHYDDPAFNGTLGRLSLAALQLGLALFTGALLHPRRGALRHVLAENPDGWAFRLRWLWYPLFVLVPVVLAGLALSGYLYTSGTLLASLVSELWLILGVITVHQLIVRWLMVTRRNLALQAALERRAQREALRAAERAGEAKPLETLLQTEAEVDLASLDIQTRRLLNIVMVFVAAIGLWLIWSDVVPALNLFENVELWRYAATVGGVEQQVPVTLADIGLVLLIIVVAVAAGKNLPALLEILLLQYSHVDAGMRYTITTLTGYVITAVAALFVFGTLGLSWGQIQWLVAALGVGIGFGLQEIVANFISGLIILFERPVRVGDIVTIGDTTGVVTRIEIRATTVRNWDRQELLVPNKEFITGRLLNWTLTDQVNRIVIPIGIEYGSDTRRALQLLREVADEHPRILEEPEPLISFEGFGDNALTLFLRCYMETLDGRIDVISQLHQAIDDKFAAAGIGIAFPQRDLHLRSSAPLEVRLHRAKEAATETARPAPAADGAGGAPASGPA